MEFCLQVDYASVVILGRRPSRIRPVKKMAAIFEMAAIAYLKFFDIVC